MMTGGLQSWLVGKKHTGMVGTVKRRGCIFSARVSGERRDFCCFGGTSSTFARPGVFGKRAKNAVIDSRAASGVSTLKLAFETTR